MPLTPQFFRTSVMASMDSNPLGLVGLRPLGVGLTALFSESQGLASVGE